MQFLKTGQWKHLVSSLLELTKNKTAKKTFCNKLIKKNSNQAKNSKLKDKQ